MVQPLSKTNRVTAGLTSHFVAGLIRTVRSTSRTTYEPHNFFDHLRAQVPFARHGDADLVARVLGQFEIEAIRGAGAGDRRKNRGGAYALRAAVKALESGSIVAMTADIPPRRPRISGEGIVTLARLSGRPIIPVAAATSRFLVLNTWSKMTVNLPFSKLAWVAGDPIFVAADANDDEMERARCKSKIRSTRSRQEPTNS